MKNFIKKHKTKIIMGGLAVSNLVLLIFAISQKRNSLDSILNHANDLDNETRRVTDKILAESFPEI